MSTELIESPEVEKLAPITKVEAQISRMRKEYSRLKILGVEDREGFNKVSTARKEVKAVRVQVEKERKSLVDDAVKWQRQVNEVAKGITIQLEEIESSLEEMEKAHIAEKERVKQEAERQRKEKIQNRIQVVMSISGMQFNGIIYSIGSASIYQSEVEGLSDTDFQSKVEELETEYQIVLAHRLEEEKRAKEESDRLEAQRKEQEAAAAELKRQQEELEAEKRRIADEQAAKEAEMKRQQAEAEAELKRQREELEAKEREHKRQEELEAARKEASEKARIEAEFKAKQEADAKAEADRVAKEKEAKRLARRPDIEKFADMREKIYNLIDQYTFNTPEGIEAFSYFEQGLAELFSTSPLSKG